MHECTQKNEHYSNQLPHTVTKKKKKWQSPGSTCDTLTEQDILQSLKIAGGENGVTFLHTGDFPP